MDILVLQLKPLAPDKKPIHSIKKGNAFKCPNCGNMIEIKNTADGKGTSPEPLQRCEKCGCEYGILLQT